MKPSLSLSLGWGLGSGPLIFLAETGQESASKSLGFVFALHLRPETRQGLVPVPRLIPTDNLHKAAPEATFIEQQLLRHHPMLNSQSWAVAVAVYMVNCATCSLFA